MTAFSEKINSRDGTWIAAYNQLDEVEHWRNQAWGYQGSSQWAYAIMSLCYAFDETILAIQMLIGRTGFVVPEATMIGHSFKHCFAYELEELPEADITWQAIAEAWVKDDFEGRFWTIGIIDRMRQIMWDEPFDLTWAARPEEKEIPSE